jgi:prephenate dehydrogenase
VRIAVLGVGLIGGSIGLAARSRAQAHVTGWDPDAGACERALALGAIDRAERDLATAVADAEIVFVAAPVGVLAGTIRAVLDSAGPGTVVTDVGSTKQALAAAVADERFVGGHPLAGSELAGVEHADGELFQGAVWYLVGPIARHPELERLIRAFGALPLPIEPERHDRLMASVSQLPHVLANLLVAQAAAALDDAPPEGFAAGPSFRDATRVAGSNSAIWTDIYMSNRDALLVAIDELSGRLAEVRAALRGGDAEALTAWNERARDAREALARAAS